MQQHRESSKKCYQRRHGTCDHLAVWPTAGPAPYVRKGSAQAAVITTAVMDPTNHAIAGDSDVEHGRALPSGTAQPEWRHIACRMLRSVLQPALAAPRQFLPARAKFRRRPVARQHAKEATEQPVAVPREAQACFVPVTQSLGVRVACRVLIFNLDMGAASCDQAQFRCSYQRTPNTRALSSTRSNEQAPVSALRGRPSRLEG
jgi:hypothetical protein